MNLSKFEQSLDYDSIYADNAILEIGSNNAKIIFYENTTRLDDDGQIDTENKHKLLKLEVRLPHEALQRLSFAALGLLKAKRHALLMKENKNDANTERAWYEYDQVIESTRYDTDDVKLDPKDLEKLNEALTNLAARINQPPKNQDD